MFGNKKRKQQIQELVQQERTMRLELARAITEDGLTGERRATALAKIAEAEKRGK